MRATIYKYCFAQLTRQRDNSAKKTTQKSSKSDLKSTSTKSDNFLTLKQKVEKPYEVLLKSPMPFMIRLPFPNKTQGQRVNDMMLKLIGNSQFQFMISDKQIMMEATVGWLHLVISRNSLSALSLTKDRSPRPNSTFTSNSKFYNLLQVIEKQSFRQTQIALRKDYFCVNIVRKLINIFDFIEEKDPQMREYTKMFSLYLKRLVQNSQNLEKTIASTPPPDSKYQKQLTKHPLTRIQKLMCLEYQLEHCVLSEVQVSKLTGKLLSQAPHSNSQKQIGSFVETVLEIKILTHLYRMQASSSFQRTNFYQHYYSLIDSFVEFIQTLQPQKILQLLEFDQVHPKNMFVVDFLPNVDLTPIKAAYLSMFRKYFESFSAGINFQKDEEIDTIFQVLLYFFDLEDSKEVIQILRQYEKSLILYGSVSWNRNTALFELCQLYEYRSDFFAQLLYRTIRKKELELLTNEPCLARQMEICRAIQLYLNIIKDPMSSQDSSKQKEEVICCKSIFLNIFERVKNEVETTKHRMRRYFIENGQWREKYDRTYNSQTILDMRFHRLKQAIARYEQKSKDTKEADDPQDLKGIFSDHAKNTRSHPPTLINLKNSAPCRARYFFSLLNAYINIFLQRNPNDHKFISKNRDFVDGMIKDEHFTKMLEKNQDYPELLNNFFVILYKFNPKPPHSHLNEFLRSWNDKIKRNLAEVVEKELLEKNLGEKKSEAIYKPSLDKLKIFAHRIDMKHKAFHDNPLKAVLYNRLLPSFLNCVKNEKLIQKMSEDSLRKHKEAQVTINVIKFPFYADVRMKILKQTYLFFLPQSNTANYLHQNQTFWKSVYPHAKLIECCNMSEIHEKIAEINEDSNKIAEINASNDRVAEINV